MIHPVHVMFEDTIAFMIALFFIPTVIIGTVFIRLTALGAY